MTSKEHLETTLKLWYSTITELEGMKDFLSIEKINIQFYRRLFLRNTFSIIETYLYVMKELVKNKLVIDKNPNQVLWSDLVILNEKKVLLDTQGNVQTKDDFQKFEPSLRFTLNIFANVFNCNLPDYGNSNFEKLKKLSKRRNDITHPKAVEELVISDQEIKDTMSMFSWFMKTDADMNNNFLVWLNSTYAAPK